MVFVGTKKQEAVGRVELARRQYAAGLLNRRIAANVERLDDRFAEVTGEPGVVTLLCACGREECDGPQLSVPLDFYRLVRTSRHRFVIAVGHAAEIDEVVYSGSRFEVVEIAPKYRLGAKRPRI